MTNVLCSQELSRHSYFYLLTWLQKYGIFILVKCDDGEFLFCDHQRERVFGVSAYDPILNVAPELAA